MEGGSGKSGNHNPMLSNCKTLFKQHVLKNSVQQLNALVVHIQERETWIWGIKKNKHHVESELKLPAEFFF